MWDSSHTHTYHTINQIGASQSPPFKSLTSSLGPTLWGSVFKPTRDYQAGSDTICNDPKKSGHGIWGPKADNIYTVGVGPLHTDWAVFLAFYNNYANWEISKFSKTALYSLIMFVIHISTNVLSSQ